jgi:hypothetical protein
MLSPELSVTHHASVGFLTVMAYCMTFINARNYFTNAGGSALIMDIKLYVILSMKKSFTLNS